MYCGRTWSAGNACAEAMRRGWHAGKPREANARTIDGSQPGRVSQGFSLTNPKPDATGVGVRTAEIRSPFAHRTSAARMSLGTVSPVDIQSDHGAGRCTEQTSRPRCGCWRANVFGGCACDVESGGSRSARAGCDEGRPGQRFAATCPGSQGGCRGHEVTAPHLALESAERRHPTGETAQSAVDEAVDLRRCPVDDRRHRWLRRVPDRAA